MSRIKLSEYRAKHLLYGELDRKYAGISIDLKDRNYSKQIAKLPAKGLYVVKVDQAVKKRGLGGLVKLKRSAKQVAADLRAFGRQGYRYALVEPFVEHDTESERYISLTRTADGILLSYSPSGGVDVESAAGKLKTALLAGTGYGEEQNTTGADNGLAAVLFQLFQKNHLTLLEINPIINDNRGWLPLDAAVEADSAGQFFVDGAWNQTDVREPKGPKHPAELAIEALNAKSPASLSLKVLNPDGALFLLLSGGGASVVVADELAQLGRHAKIANYGEYSGNPNADETYIYTREILGLLLESKARKKVLVIAGGVANFTDVAKTFAGVIRALRESAAELKRQKVQVLVRRGGPNQARGLAAMRDFLADVGLKNSVYGPENTLSAVVAQAAKAAV